MRRSYPEIPATTGLWHTQHRTPGTDSRMSSSALLLQIARRQINPMEELGDISVCVSGSVAVSAAGDSVLTPPVAARATVLYSAARGSTTLLATRTYMGLQNIALLLKLLHEY